MIADKTDETEITNLVLFRMAEDMQRRVNSILREVNTGLKAFITHATLDSIKNQHLPFSVQVVLNTEVIGVFQYNVAVYEAGPSWVCPQSFGCSIDALRVWRSYDSALNARRDRHISEIADSLSSLRKLR